MNIRRTVIAAAAAAATLLAGAGISLAATASSPTAVKVCVNSRTRALTQPKAGTAQFSAVCPPGAFPESLAKAVAPTVTGPSALPVSTSDLGGIAVVPTGGSFVANATQVGTIDLAPGTYEISANAKVTANVAETVGVHPEFFVYDQAANPSFAGDLWNFGGAALPLGNTSIDTYDSAAKVITVTSATTLHVYAFGYDDDRGAGTFTLDDLAFDIVKIG